jgi:hypothetical protein
MAVIVVVAIDFEIHVRLEETAEIVVHQLVGSCVTCVQIEYISLRLKKPRLKFHVQV